MNARIPLLSLALLFLGATTVHAATYCVTNGAQLNAALIFAQSNGEADSIRMATGFYTFPGGGTFTYRPDVNSGETFDIEISGGWTPFFEDPCGQQFDTDAFSSVITTSLDDQLLVMQLPINGADTTMSLRRITFLGGGGSAEPSSAGAVVRVTGSTFTGTLLVDQCAFLNNEAIVSSALRMIATGGTIRLSNSLFRENHSTETNTVLLAMSSGVGIYATNNTIIDNTATAGPTGGLRVFTSGAGTQALVANNNLWGNQGADLNLIGLNTTVRNNNIEVRSGTAPIAESGNISVQPVYESGSLDYTPAAGSALIDAGIEPPAIVPMPIPFIDAWSTGTIDLLSRQRIRGLKIDIGAYESDGDRIFKDGFD